MNKKGFTLIELLAVIVILAVISLIAVPTVMNMIEESRVGAFKQTNEGVIRAARNYIAIHDESLPRESGDTVEVSVSDLVDNDFLSVINNPFKSGECSGYVLITKVEDGYEFIPHINCFEDINSSLEDGLVVRYTFFEKPIINLASNASFEGGATDGWLMGSSTTLVEEGRLSNYALEFEGVDGAARVTGNETELSPGTYTMQVWYEHITGDVPYFFSHVGFNGSFTILNNFELGPGLKVATIRMDVVDDSIPPQIRYAHSVPVDRLVGTVKIHGVQIEIEEEQSNFAGSNRTNLIFDYSTNNNHINMGISKPIWSDGKYYLDNSTTLDLNLEMNNTNYGRADAEYTHSIWVNLNEHSMEGNSVIFGMAYYTGFGIRLTSNGETSTSFGTYFRNRSGQIMTSTSPVNLGEWYHLVSVLDRPNGLIYFYKNGELIDQRNISNEDFAYENYPFSINRRNQPGGNGPWANMNGYIKDVIIYNRALSSDEIKMMYNQTK